MKGHTHQSAILTWTLHIRKDSIIHISTTSIKKEHRLDIYQFLHIHCSNTQPVQRGRIKAQKLHVLCVCCMCYLCYMCDVCVACVCYMCYVCYMCNVCVACVVHVCVTCDVCYMY